MFSDKISRNYNGLEEVQRAKCSRAGLFGEKERGGAFGMSDAERLFEFEGIDNREHVVGKSVPLKGPIIWRIGIAMRTHIDRPLVETREVRGERFPNTTVESGCMGKEEWGPLATEIVDLEFDAIGGGNSHASILPLRCG